MTKLKEQKTIVHIIKTVPVFYVSEILIIYRIDYRDLGQE